MNKSVVATAPFLLLMTALHAREIQVEGRGILIIDTRETHPLTTGPGRTKSTFGGAAFPRQVPGLVAGMEYATHDARDPFPTGVREESGQQNDNLDTRTDESIDRVKASEPGPLLIAVSRPDAAGGGWARVSRQPTPDFLLERNAKPDPARTYWFYQHAYDHAHAWVTLPPHPEPGHPPPFVFGRANELRWANPLPLPDHGVVISRGTKVCNPSMCILPNGDYLAFASGCSDGALFRSKDKGTTWEVLCRSNFGINRQSIFSHDNAVYLFGLAREKPRGMHSLMYRSTDQGKTWSKPVYFRSVGGEDAPSHVDVVNGRIWKAYCSTDKGVPAGLLSAPVDADLMNEASWTLTKRVTTNPSLPGGMNAHAGNEGTLLVTREGRVANAVKGSATIPGKGACTGTALVYARDKDVAVFDPDKDFAILPGAHAKYTIRYDKTSDRYWALTSTGHPRNILCLYRSRDLKTFTMVREILRGPSSRYHGFNYPHMFIEGDDIIFVSRTAWETGRGCSLRWHDANMFTFHRIRNFRD